MRPLYPAIFSAEAIAGLRWAEQPENTQFYWHVRNICKTFPSLVLAYSARPGLAELAAILAEGFMDCGINVFMPGEASPVCALSQAIGARTMPIGLYLDGDETSGNLTLAALSSHGGPFNEKDIFDSPFSSVEKGGVAGVTELNGYYASNLAGLADRFIEKGAGFAAFEIPFAGLEGRLREIDGLAILFQHDPYGPTARISPDGQGLLISDKSGKDIGVAEIASTITDYLRKERLASGTIVGPASENSRFAGNCETIGVEGSLFDMNFKACFADLLIGWWHNGVIAHQGSSCFGDAILSAIYFLEARRCMVQGA